MLFLQTTGAAVILGVFKVIMTSIAALSVDSWGRRPLLLGGVSFLVVALLGLSIFAYVPYIEGVMAAWLSWANVAALLLYVGAYQVDVNRIDLTWLKIKSDVLYPANVAMLYTWCFRSNTRFYDCCVGPAL